MSRSLSIALLLLALVACGRAPQPGAGTHEPFVFGMILVGPINDHGWSQANYEGGKYVEEKIPGTKMIYVDNLNPGAKPGVTVPQVVEDMVAKGARLIFATSDDFKDGCDEAARKHPDVCFVSTSGDYAWKDGRNYKPLPNVANIMGYMEYGEAMAGYVAALTTKTGKIGYIGPLINDETRRLANATYLGALHAWTGVLGRDPRDLTFKVTWIGFWFNIPGQTLDPTTVSDDFFNTGFDVLITGLDTTENLVEARKMRQKGKTVWAVPYDYKNGCDEAPEVALGVPYFNWGPAYVKAVRRVMDGTWQSFFEWNGPDWRDINDPHTSAIGFTRGQALTPESAARLDAYVKGLGDGSIRLFVGPLNYQDGSVFLRPGEVASDTQVWYQGQLLSGMIGPSK